MIGDEYAESPVPQASHDPLQLGDRNRINGGERFVQQQEPGIGRERPGDLGASPLAAREGMPQVPPALGEAEFREQRPDSFAPLAPSHPGYLFKDCQHVLLDREATEDGRLLREISDPRTRAAMQGEAGEIPIIEQHRAVIRLDQSDDHAKRGGLPRSIRSQETDHFSACDPNRHLIHDPAHAVGLDQVMTGENVSRLGLRRGRRRARRPTTRRSAMGHRSWAARDVAGAETLTTCSPGGKRLSPFRCVRG